MSEDLPWWQKPGEAGCHLHVEIRVDLTQSGHHELWEDSPCPPPQGCLLPRLLQMLSPSHRSGNWTDSWVTPAKSLVHPSSPPPGCGALRELLSRPLMLACQLTRDLSACRERWQLALWMRKQAQGSKGVLPQTPHQEPECSFVPMTGPHLPGDSPTLEAQEDGGC